MQYKQFSTYENNNNNIYSINLSLTLIANYTRICCPCIQAFQVQRNFVRFITDNVKFNQSSIILEAFLKSHIISYYHSIHKHCTCTKSSREGWNETLCGSYHSPANSYQWQCSDIP